MHSYVSLGFLSVTVSSGFHFVTARAMLSRYMLWPWVRPSVCVSVCLSQVGVLLKWLNIGKRKQRHTIAQGLYFSGAKNIFEIRAVLIDSWASCFLSTSQQISRVKRLQINFFCVTWDVILY